MADVKDFLAGFFAGIVSLLASHPLDTLKVRQQTFNCNLATAAKNTMQFEGIKGFYKGITFPLLAWGPYNSIFFGVYGNFLKFLENRGDSGHHNMHIGNFQEMLRVFEAGCIAGIPSSIFISPVEYIKIILQAKIGAKDQWKQHYVVPYNGVFEAITGIYKDDGVRGFYRGFGALCLREVPTAGIYVLVYEILRYSTLDNYISNSKTKEIIAGGTAGTLSVVVALPVDVVKTSIQTDNPRKPIYKGIVHCTKRLYAASGMRIFFKGLPVLCMRAFPAHAIMFACYEFIMSF